MHTAVPRHNLFDIFHFFSRLMLTLPLYIVNRGSTALCLEKECSPQTALPCPAAHRKNFNRHGTAAGHN